MEAPQVNSKAKHREEEEKVLVQSPGSVQDVAPEKDQAPAIALTDEENPRKWPGKKKWRNVLLISFQATLTPIASTLLAVGSLALAVDFELTDTYVVSLPTALFVLGNGLGPMYLAPLSELYGRRIVYIGSFGLFTLFNVGCALSPNIAALSIFRLCSGMAGSAASTLSGASVGDMFTREERGRAQALYAFAPIMGPVIGGVMAGFIVSGTGGWRWLMWVVVIAPAVTVLLCVFFLRETYGPVLLRRKAGIHVGKHGNQDVETANPGLFVEPRELFLRAITRPVRLLIFSPICTSLSLYMAVIYGILYFHYITLSLLFGPNSVYGLFSYEWTTGFTGLSYLGTGVGGIIGVLICGKYLNRAYLSMAAHIEKKTGESGLEPEARLPFMQLGMLISPVGLILFAWSAEYHVHWIVPLIGATIYGIGMLMTYICIQIYVVDAFEEYAASAVAATIVLRSIGACVLSTVGFKLYETLGYGWGTMLLAFMTLALSMIPYVLYKFGPHLRRKGLDASR